MNSLIGSKENRIEFLSRDFLNIKGGAFSMSVVNWSLKLSSFNISININKDIKKHSNKITREINQERACQQAFSLRDKAEVLYNSSTILR